MKKKLILGLFSLLVLFQISIPLGMIVKRESVLKTGEQFKFKTAPVDPFDAFRGRYVALRLEADKAPRPEGLEIGWREKVYAHITVGRDGFASFSTLSLSRPKDVAYIEAKSRYTSDNKNEIGLLLPIDRYYMEESAAPAAEKAYREHSRRKKRDAYVTVRVRQGFAVIEGLYVGGKPIEEVVGQAK